ncbi:MAG TPA: hypothetical protein VD816_10420 [Ohtaekwangia sp.]|nr:hypothetical protein [Ohtaekwangia sp.]
MNERHSINILVAFLACVSMSVLAQEKGYVLVWTDEFHKDGIPDSTKWNYERGFVRNEELQWYQAENAYCKNGMLMIEARRTSRSNADYDPMSDDWRKNSRRIEYTSACLITKERHVWAIRAV